MDHPSPTFNLGISSPPWTFPRIFIHFQEKTHHQFSTHSVNGTWCAIPITSRSISATHIYFLAGLYLLMHFLPPLHVRSVLGCPTPQSLKLNQIRNIARRYLTQLSLLCIWHIPEPGIVSVGIHETGACEDLKPSSKNKKGTSMLASASVLSARSRAAS